MMSTPPPPTDQQSLQPDSVMHDDGSGSDSSHFSSNSSVVSISSSHSIVTNGHVSIHGHSIPLIRCQCGESSSFLSSLFDHAARCASTTLPAHCVAVAAMMTAGSNVRRSPTASPQDGQQHPNYCNLLAKFCEGFGLTAPDGSPLHSSHISGLSMESLMRLSKAVGFLDIRAKGELGRRGTYHYCDPDAACSWLKAGGGKKSRGLRYAVKFIRACRSVQPSSFAADPNKLKGGSEQIAVLLPILFNLDLPSTLLAHEVRFHDPLPSETVKWCNTLVQQGRLVQQRRSNQSDAPTLCSCLADLLKAKPDTLNLQPFELDQLAMALRLDGVFVKPRDDRSQQLRPFIIETLNLNRDMEHQLNRLEYPQLFPSAPPSPTSSVASMDVVLLPLCAPPSPSASSVTSSASNATAQPFGLQSFSSQSDDHDQPDDDGRASKRQRTESGFLSGLSKQQHPDCIRDLSEDLPSPAAQPAAAPRSPTPPPSALPAEATEFDWRSLLDDSVLFPDPSPSTPA